MQVCASPSGIPSRKKTSDERWRLAAILCIPWWFQPRNISGIVVRLLQQEQKRTREHSARAVGCQPFREVPQVPLTLSEFPWLLAEVDAVRLFRMVLKPAFTWEKEYWRSTCTWTFSCFHSYHNFWASKRQPLFVVCCRNLNNVYKILQSLAAEIVKYSWFCSSNKHHLSIWLLSSGVFNCKSQIILLHRRYYFRLFLMGHSQISCLKSVEEEDYTWLALASIQAWEGKVRVAGHHSAFPIPPIVGLC